MNAGFVIPVKRYRTRPGRMVLPARLHLAGERGDELPLSQLAGDLKSRYGVTADINKVSPAEAHVRIVRDRAIEGDEAYRLAVSPGGVEISARGEPGAYYGVQTLRELVRIHGRRLPCCEIADWPDFTRRGLYYDCSRGKVPKLSTLKSLVERLAHWKINELQLYVENVFAFRRHPEIGRGFSPLTAADILALQRFCKQHHIRLVGSLASFGHMERILEIPRYAHLGELPGWRGWRGGTTLSPADPGSIALVRDLYEEFAPLFTAGDFNACGDEPWELGKGRSRALAEKLGTGELYRRYMTKVHAICRRLGKRTNLWADIVLEHPEMLARWPKEIVMLNWDYVPGARRMRQTRKIGDAGLAAMVCPGTNGWLSHGCRLAMGMTNIAESATIGRRCGAEGLLNTDWGDFGHRNMLAVSLHNMAYGGAAAWDARGAGAEAFAVVFTENFCRDTFDSPTAGEALAASLRTLGGADEFFGQGHSGSRVLYWSLLFPLSRLAQTEDRYGKLADTATAAILAKYRNALEQISWPSPRQEADPFLANMLEEFALAAKLDAVACLRVAALKKLRSRKPIAASEWNNLTDRTRQLAAEFNRIWRLGNRPSRLRDNLGLFAGTLAEYTRGPEVRHRWPDFHCP